MALCRAQLPWGIGEIHGDVRPTGLGSRRRFRANALTRLSTYVNVPLLAGGFGIKPALRRRVFRGFDWSGYWALREIHNAQGQPRSSLFRCADFKRDCHIGTHHANTVTVCPIPGRRKHSPHFLQLFSFQQPPLRRQTEILARPATAVHRAWPSSAACTALQPREVPLAERVHPRATFAFALT